MFETVANYFRPSRKNSVMITTGPCKAPLCVGFCDAGEFEVSDGEFLPSSLLCVRCLHTFDTHERAPDRTNLPRQNTSRSDIENRIRSTDPGSLLPPTHTDSNIYPRPETIKNLWTQLIKVGVLSARATPTAGKSILADLLKTFVEINFPEVEIVSFSWRGRYANGDFHLPLSATYQKIFREYADVLDVDGLLKNKIVLVIVDEAQNSYSYDSFWTEFIKGKADGVGSPYTLLLSSFGSPGAVMTQFDGSAPFHFAPSQRISARSLSENNPEVSLYLNKYEFDELMALSNKNKTTYLKYTPGAMDYLFRFTSGHVGAIRMMQEFLQERLRPLLRTQTEVEDTAVQSAIYDNTDSFVRSITFSIAAFKRSIVEENAMRADPQLAMALKTALSAGSLQAEILPEEKGLSQVYRKGYLQAEIDNCGNTVYVFPSHLHRLCVEYRLMANSHFPFDRFPTLETLVLAVLPHFSPAALRAAGNILSTGSQSLPVEASYQSELYRTIYKVLGERCFVTSEFSASSTGRIDFALKIPGWGIEALRESTDSTLREHVGRFGRDGAYQKWILRRHLNEGCVIDFRTSMPKFPTLKEAYCKVYHVVYGAGFQHCAVYTHEGKEVKKVALLEN